MTAPFAPWTLVAIIAALAVGVAMGLFHFQSLRRAADAFAEGRAVSALALQTLRLAAMAAFLFGAAYAGAFPLLAAALGILIGKAAVLRREGKG